MRSKLARDLHDDLGSTLNSVSIYTHLALIEKDDKYLYKIKDSAQEALNGVRDILWNLDDSKERLEDLVSRINSFASFLCVVKNISFNLEMSKEASNYKLNHQEKRNLYMIIKEAINNSIKYSEGTEIKLCIHFYKGKPVIIIKDDGKGYRHDKDSEGNGIRNMKNRASTIHYNISINSTKGVSIQLEKI